MLRHASRSTVCPTHGKRGSMMGNPVSQKLGLYANMSVRLPSLKNVSLDRWRMALALICSVLNALEGGPPWLTRERFGVAEPY